MAIHAQAALLVHVASVAITGPPPSKQPARASAPDAPKVRGRFDWGQAFHPLIMSTGS